MRRPLLQFFLLVLFQLIYLRSSAQIPTVNYAFQALQGTYTPVVGAAGSTPVSTSYGAGIMTDDSWNTSIPIGFTFNFSGNNYTQLSADANGWISLANLSPSSSYAYCNDCGTGYITGPGALWAFWDDLYGGGSPAAASYIVTGVAPNRVFTLEWSQWGVCCSTTPYFSFEVKLFETTKRHTICL